MLRRPPNSTRHDTPYPYTPLVRALDDRTLKDIGVYRCELWRVAAGDVRRESAIAASEPFAGEASAPANDNPVSCGPRRPAVCRGGHANDERRPAAAPL